MTGTLHIDASEVATLLARRIDDLVAHLLPSGRRKGRYWTVGSIDDEPGGSLWVHLSGGRVGRWQDAATGEFGDALDLVAGARFRGDKKQAYAWSLAWLGIGGDMAVAPSKSQPTRARVAPPSDEDDRLRRYALRIWLEGQPSILGTPAAEYLAGRGIDLARLGRQPRALRFHPSLPHRSGRSFPALVATISGADGTHLATHRTWLDRGSDGNWTKAPIEDPKMTVGTYPGGSIRLWRGASGKPLKDAPADETVAIGEGIETCLSVALACPELRVLSAVSLANSAGVWLPPQVRNILLLRDNDMKPEAQAAFQRVVEHHLDAGRIVRVARSPIGNDFNDARRAWATAA